MAALHEEPTPLRAPQGKCVDASSARAEQPRQAAGLFSGTASLVPNAAVTQRTILEAMRTGDRYTDQLLTPSAADVAREHARPGSAGVYSRAARLARMPTGAGLRRKRLRRLPQTQPFSLAHLSRCEAVRSYSAVEDKHLAVHFSRKVWRKELVEKCLVTRGGQVVPEHVQRKGHAVVAAVDEAVREALVADALRRVAATKQAAAAAKHSQRLRAALESQARVTDIRAAERKAAARYGERVAEFEASRPQQRAKRTLFDHPAVKAHLQRPPLCQSLYPHQDRIRHPSVSGGSRASARSTDTDDDASCYPLSRTSSSPPCSPQTQPSAP